MADDSRDEILDLLRRGDAAAAEALFTAYTPYLRAVVRRQLSDRLRSQFDSADVVQSVWVQVVRRLGRDGWLVSSEGDLRALLATIASRRLYNRVRRHAAPADQGRVGGGDREAGPDHRHPRPSQVAEAGELWDRILANCPPEHHPIVRLRRDGLGLAEIAERTGLHEGSVRRVLRRLARELALRDEPLSDGGPVE